MPIRLGPVLVEMRIREASTGIDVGAVELGEVVQVELEKLVQHRRGLTSSPSVTRARREG